MAITLKDIAKMAHVSTATVSRVLNDKAVGNMKPETCERIKKIIENTGYTPHALASSLRKGLSRVVGVIFPDNVNPYYAQLGKAIENECFRNGYLTLICNSNSDVSREKDYIRHLTSQRVAGILLCSTGLSGREIKTMIPHNIRVIMVDEEVDDFEGELVIGDDSVGGYLGADYLYGLGHEKILIIKAPDVLSSSRNRLNGFLKQTLEREKFFDVNFVIGGDYNTLESGYKAVNQALERELKFTAIFSFNDLMAIGALKALFEKNYRVPEDISVLGYDNIFLDELVRPRITTVATPLEELGKLAVKKLLQLTKSKKRKEMMRFTLKPKLIIRDSCLKLS